MKTTVTRRTALAFGAAAAASTIMRPGIGRAAAPFEQPPLPYAEDALAPDISARTVALHYGKHHKGYFTKLNELVAGTKYADLSLEDVVVQSHKDGELAIFNQAAQGWNHNFYWEQFKGGPAKPEGDLAARIESGFGHMGGLVEEFGAAADAVFGTGWVWLVMDGEKVALRSYQDAGNPLQDGLKSLVGIDVWEHAYYLDYENLRAKHVTRVLNNRVNWVAVAERMA
ncbi:MAG: superoxide dismutase [Rhizobiaceae bacterium]|nr:superoxide dismutase [Rhizobiaceae bacterium]